MNLNSGYEMPIVGIGTYSLTGSICADAVTCALRSGMRLVDTAYMYHNEEAVGEGIRNSGIGREVELSDEEMATIDALNRDEKHDWY